MDGDGFRSVTAGAVMSVPDAVVTIASMLFALGVLYIVRR